MRYLKKFSLLIKNMFDSIKHCINSCQTICLSFKYFVSKWGVWVCESVLMGGTIFGKIHWCNTWTPPNTWLQDLCLNEGQCQAVGDNKTCVCTPQFTGRKVIKGGITTKNQNLKAGSKKSKKNPSPHWIWKPQGLVSIFWKRLNYK